MGGILIGVCGGTGSGKTTIARKIIEAVGPERVIFLQQDAYYKDLSHLSLEERHQVNFDHPNSLDFSLLIEHARTLLGGSPIEQPVYNFATHTRTGKHQRIEPRPIVLIDGILIFAEEGLREMMDLKVFVDTEADLRFIRRLERDIRERGRTAETVVHQYLATVRPMHMELVEPSRRHADIIIPEGGHNQISIELIAAWIREQYRILSSDLNHKDTKTQRDI
jgi:uridine kinase